MIKPKRITFDKKGLGGYECLMCHEWIQRIEMKRHAMRHKEVSHERI